MTNITLSARSLTLSNSSQHKDARLFDDPVMVEKQAFEKREEMRKEIIAKHVGENVERCSRTLPWRARVRQCFSLHIVLGCYVSAHTGNEHPFV